MALRCRKASPIKIVAGLGNPGSEYRDTRHNVGFQVIDLLSVRHHIALGHHKYQALWGQGHIGGGPVMLVRPLTFMNLSGRSVKALLKGVGREPQDLLVVHDDIDLAVGTIKLKSRGGDAGHRGIRSILEEMGTDCFQRVRVGVGRPPRGMDVSDYVLSPFPSLELAEVSKAIEKAADLIEDLLEEVTRS